MKKLTTLIFVLCTTFCFGQITPLKNEIYNQFRSGFNVIQGASNLSQEELFDSLVTTLESADILIESKIRPRLLRTSVIRKSHANAYIEYTVKGNGNKEGSVLEARIWSTNNGHINTIVLGNPEAKFYRLFTGGRADSSRAYFFKLAGGSVLMITGDYNFFKEETK